MCVFISSAYFNSAHFTQGNLEEPECWDELIQIELTSYQATLLVFPQPTDNPHKLTYPVCLQCHKDLKRIYQLLFSGDAQGSAVAQGEREEIYHGSCVSFRYTRAVTIVSKLTWF